MELERREQEIDERWEKRWAECHHWRPVLSEQKSAAWQIPAEWVAPAHSLNQTSRGRHRAGGNGHMEPSQSSQQRNADVTYL